MGTRGSALALTQSSWVAEEFMKLEPGLSVETVVIKTTGDRFGAPSPEDAKSIPSGVKGLFVKEIEEALLAGTIDFAVHSAKDLPAELALGLEIAAYPKREDARDVFIGQGGLVFSKLSVGHRLGSSSLRRSIQLRMSKPGVTVIPLRGNVDTRLKKLKAGEFDGILLAAAGLKRLKLWKGEGDSFAEPVPPELIIPAAGQGALAVEAKAGASPLSSLLARLDDSATRAAVEIERSIVSACGGNCSTPLGAYAVVTGKKAVLSVFWSREDGSKAQRLTETCEDWSCASSFAASVASRLDR
jgi:hydroxymethylbilane synthase